MRGPICSVRSTNVYEEQSLGIFNENSTSGDDDEEFNASGNKMHVWSRYLTMHARKQLAFGAWFVLGLYTFYLIAREDMWWLGLAVFLVCIIEVSTS